MGERRRCRGRRLAIAAVFVLVAALAGSQYWVLTGRFGTVDPGRLYRGAAVSPAALVAFCERHAITRVIDLRKTGETTAREADALARAGIAYSSLPGEQVPDAATVARFLAILDAAPAERVLIHCTHGVGRTGVFSAIYRMEYQGWSPRRALVEAWIYSGFGSFWPGSEKAAFLAGYLPRHER